MIKKAIKRAIRKVDEQAAINRFMYVENPPTKLPISDTDIDQVSDIFISQEQQLLNNLLGGDIGLLPLLQGSMGWKAFNITGVTDYLIMKGTLNALYRRLNPLFDWQVWELNNRERFIQFPTNFREIVIAYIPEFDEDKEEWAFYNTEWDFVEEFAWAEICKRSAEALMAATPLGVNTEAVALFDKYTQIQEKLVKDFHDSSPIFGIQ
jgi:hypothetical protein